MIPEASRPRAFHVMEPIPPVEFLEKTLATQEARLEQLARDNRILISSHMRLVDTVAAARMEADKLREHIRNIQAEGDIEVRIILDRYSKIEAEIGAGDTVRRDIQEARKEAQSLLTSKMMLTSAIDQATKELAKARVDIDNIPRMHVQLDSLRQEQLRLRKTFEYEKGLNTEKVEQMKRLEKDLVVVAEEVEKLRNRLSEAERRTPAAVPCDAPFVNRNPPNPLPAQRCYAESFSRPHLHLDGGDSNSHRNQNDAGTSHPPALEKGAGDSASGTDSDMSYDEL